MIEKRKRVSIKDVAADVKMSVSAVSQVLRGSDQFTLETRQLIQESAKRLGYYPNPAARGLVGAKTNTVGIIVRDFEGYDSTLGVHRMVSLLWEKGYGCLIVCSHGEEDIELSVIEDLRARGTDGLVLCDYSPRPRVKERVRELVAMQYPVVVRDAESIATGADCVLGRGAKRPHDMFEHLIGLGHRRIALVYPKVYTPLETVYRERLAAAGIPFDPSLLVTHNVESSVAPLCKTLMALPSPPTAIATRWDTVAADLMVHLIDAGHRIPEDVSVIGYDGAWFAPYLRRSLTTFQHNWKLTAEASVRMLLKRIETPQIAQQVQVFDSQLIIGDSTGPAPAR